MKGKPTFSSLVFMILESTAINMKVDAIISMSTETKLLNLLTGNSDFLFSSPTKTWNT